MIDIEPLGGNIFVQKVVHTIERVSAGGLHIPDIVETTDDLDEGLVVAVGKGEYQGGVLMPGELKVGETIYFRMENVALIFTYKGTEYLLMRDRTPIAKERAVKEIKGDA